MRRLPAETALEELTRTDIRAPAAQLAWLPEMKNLSPVSRQAQILQISKLTPRKLARDAVSIQQSYSQYSTILFNNLDSTIWTAAHMYRVRARAAPIHHLEDKKGAPWWSRSRPQGA